MSEDQRREEMLREMGISPIWRLRAAPGVAVEDQAPAPVPAVRTLIAEEPSLQTVPAAAPSADVANMDWTALKSCVADCTACGLHKGRNKTVFGVGDQRANWLFVGEGPGAGA